MFKVTTNQHTLQRELEYVAFSIQNERENNEDSFLVTTLLPRPGHSPLTLLAIADGMGGHAHGEDISREALRKLGLTLCEQLIIAPSINEPNERQTISFETLETVLLDAVDQVNLYVRSMVERNQWIKAGSTIVAAIIRQDEVVAVNVGDSPLYHFKDTLRQLTKITEDHTVAGTLLRAGVITPRMAQVHEGNNQLEYYLGSQHLPRQRALHRFQLAQDDLLLLCSDGISSALTEVQIEKILANAEGDLESTAEELISSASNSGSTDNQTLILMRHNSYL